MKRKFSLWTFLCLVALFLLGCGIGENTSAEKKAEEEPITLEEQVINAIHLNIEMAEKEDLDG